MTKTCDCDTCQKINKFKYFKNLLPVKTQQDFSSWFDSLLGELDYLTTEFYYLKSKKNETDTI